MVSTLKENPVALGKGHGAKKGAPAAPREKLVVPESIAVMVPVTWLGSSSMADAVKETDAGGPQTPEAGPAPVLVNVPGVMVT